MEKNNNVPPVHGEWYWICTNEWISTPVQYDGAVLAFRGDTIWYRLEDVAVYQLIERAS